VWLKVMDPTLAGRAGIIKKEENRIEKKKF
jgi:hypothetical protein